ncbi:MAG TPA: TetR/AcrR family transcriptional regulator C-terminal domain-containing protein [Eubacteriales bacterium]|nr:TetR/AcrR family transcriptional regulator C-terminal domain-containing protein [Eubacteriales bacterium]HRU83961.1 TetR/AcrR family transcriptional regulator C-terminal domain-containing protein [Eubacteriales bacterium]
MKTIKNDHRSRYTREVAQKTLLRLLCEKPLNKITVIELCEEANLNRGTFYNHFFDIYDVFESIENKFFDEFKAKLDAIKVYDLSSPFIQEIIMHIYLNRDISRLVVGSINNNSFLNRIIQFMRDKYIKEWSENNHHIPRELIEQVFSYSVNGVLGLIAEWINSGMKQSPDSIAEIVCKLNKVVTDGCFKNYKPKSE